MNKNKSSLATMIFNLTISTLLSFGLIIAGVIVKFYMACFVGAITLMVFTSFYIYQIVSYANKQRKEILTEIDKQTDTKILEKYSALKSENYSDVGYVTFTNEGLKFSAKGKYGYIKDFNDIPGYHLAFRIEGTELVDKPKDYEDIVSYQDLLFNIELGYYDGELLSESENDNGIIVNDINNLEGKTIKIKQADGYIAVINTADLDEISIGEIKFVKWNENSKIIQFKLLVEYGLCDIVVGTVELTEDKQ